MVDVPIRIVVVFSGNVATGAAFGNLLGFGNTAVLLIVIVPAYSTVSKRNEKGANTRR
jgi:hypothetical protein